MTKFSLFAVFFCSVVWAGPIDTRFEGVYDVELDCQSPASDCKKLGQKSTLSIVSGVPSAENPFGLSLMLRHPKFAMSHYLFFASRVQGNLTIQGRRDGNAEIEVTLDPNTMELVGRLRAPRFDGDVMIRGPQKVSLASVTSAVGQLSPQQLVGNFRDTNRGSDGVLAIRVGFSGKLLASYRVPPHGVILAFDNVEYDAAAGTLTLIYSARHGEAVKWFLGANLSQKGQLSLSGVALSTATGGATKRVFARE